MKTFTLSTLYALALSIVLALSIAAVEQAAAEDLLIEAVAKQVISKIDKKGKPFLRVIIEQERTIKGNIYMRTVPVLFFSDLFDEAEKSIAKGQSFKAIVSKRTYQGRDYYTGLALLKQ